MIIVKLLLASVATTIIGGLAYVYSHTERFESTSVDAYAAYATITPSPALTSRPTPVPTPQVVYVQSAPQTVYVPQTEVQTFDTTVSIDPVPKGIRCNIWYNPYGDSVYCN